MANVISIVSGTMVYSNANYFGGAGRCEANIHIYWSEQSKAPTIVHIILLLLVYIYLSIQNKIF